ncbi:unnamed protein product [Sphagnum jensenii]|uniref:Transcriptional adapter n=1 Tax=Sphagnum jensenii TaxID=128206 RepID=A0ABP1ASF9_9BRYO
MGRSRGPLASGEDETAWSKRRRGAAGGESDANTGQLCAKAKRALYHCNYCNKDISGTIRIKCNKCPDFDLCVECFSVGVEITPHKCNHSYRVIDNLSFPLIHPDWNADEEILLLEAVEMYGLGNWGEVAEHVGTKSKTLCFDHYMTTYMNSTCSPLPDMSHVIGKSKAELLAMARTHQEGKKGTKDVKPLLSTPGSEGDDGEVRASGSQVASDSGGPTSGRGSKGQKVAGGIQGKEAADSPATGTATEDGGHSIRSIGGKKPKPVVEDNKTGISSAEQSGYNAKRQEFDPEYDNDAEIPLADMEFKDNDTETDRELKLRMLHIYLSRLDERKRRKDFILERGLLNLKRQQSLDRKRTKEERELYQRSRVFMRYQTMEEHEALVAGLNAERKLRQRIEELQEYRMAGCRTLAEGEQYGSEKKKRELEASLRKSRENTAYLYSGKATHRSNRYMNREKEAEAASSGITTKDNNQKGRSSSSHHLLSGSSLLASTGVKGAKRTGVPLDLAGHPGVELLSLTEQDLCSQFRLLPAHYLKMKETLMLESMKRGQVSRQDAYHMFKVDPIKTDRVYELLVAMGWIQGDAPTLL